jgi:hypothetical protein
MSSAAKDRKAAEDAGREHEEARFLVNQTELVQIAGISAPTLRDYMRKYPETFPIVEGGSNGRDYVFDVREVRKFLDGLEEEKRQAEAKRRAELADLQRDFFGEALEDEGALELTPDQRKKLADAKHAENRLSEQQGQLVKAAEVRQAVERAFLQLRRRLEGLGQEIAKTYGLDRPARIAIDERVREILEAVAQDLEKTKGAGDADLAA